SGFQQEGFVGNGEAVTTRDPSSETQDRTRRSGRQGPVVAASPSVGGAAGGAAAAGSSKKLATILCCLCGRPIQPNGANMCGACLQDQVDVTEGIPKKGLTIIQCRRCLKWLTKNDHWSTFELESAPFLALVLKKIPGLAKQDLVDAKWIWTEPHSKRLKVRITVRKEVLNKVMLQQDATVEFVVHNRQCNVCNKEFTNQTWKAIVQIRQRAGHKRTMMLLEQRILQADAHRKCISVETVRGGMDVYFGAKHDAVEFVGYLSSVAPIRSRESTKARKRRRHSSAGGLLVSTDNHSNVRNTQHTVAVDVPTLCRDDLVALPRGSGNRLQGTIAVVQRVTSVVQFVGPSSGQTADMPADRYWRSPPEPLLSASSLTEFVVLDCEPADGFSAAGGGGGGGGGGKKGRSAASLAAGTKNMRLWEVVVALDSEVGSADDTFTVLTHLSADSAGRHPLEAGDMLLGYDLRGKNFNEALLSGLSGDVPDIVLVKRAPPPKTAQSKKKRYKLRSLDGAGGGGGGGADHGKEGRRGGGGGGGKASHAEGNDEREIAALIEELSMDEELRAELGVVPEPDEEHSRAVAAESEGEHEQG
ncbi:unnamed protein product, partial [Ectocarpus sp. 12 AP-2014]